MKTRIRSLLALFCALTLLLCAVPAFAEDAEAPDITHFNLAFDNEVHLLYRIDFSAIPNFTPTKNNCGVLFWKEEPTGATIGTEDKLLLPQITEIDGADAYVVKYTDLNATQMCDTVWARAFAVVDGEYRYSELVDYSIVRYAKTMLGYEPGVSGSTNSKLRQMLCDMIQYGESAQKYFGYNLEHFPTDILPKNQFTVRFIADGYNVLETQTVCRGRRAAEPAVQERDGYKFLGWYADGYKWDFSSNTVNQDITIYARWNSIGDYSTGLEFIPKDDGTCEVAGGSCIDSDIRIPPTSPDGDKVTAIFPKGFAGNDQLTSITIPGSVISVGEYAFGGLRYLERVTFSSGTVLIDREAFKGCTSLMEVVLSDTLGTIGEEAFLDCSRLCQIDLPESVTTIRANAFSGCQMLGSITIPSKITAIEDGTFSGCTSLSTLTLPDNLLSIGTSAFYKCENLSRLTIPENVTTIGSKAFYQCGMLTELYIPDHVTRIEYSAFSGCSQIQTLSVPFLGIQYSDTLENARSITIFDIFGESGAPFMLNSIEVRGGTEIPDGAFQGCYNLMRIQLAEGIQKIGGDLFDNTSLNFINIPKSVTEIGDFAFSPCSNLTSIQYAGTLAEWRQITKGPNWYPTGSYDNCTVTCTDGSTPANDTINPDLPY